MTDDNYEILVRNIEMLMQNKNMIPADLIRDRHCPVTSKQSIKPYTENSIHF